MNESKIELTERLRREGRWAEASKFKDTALAEFRAKGMKRNEAGDEAWRQMAEQYPPLPAEDVVVDAGRVRGLQDIPESWPEIPGNASLQAELRWCKANQLRVVEEMPGGVIRVHLERAASPAPSWGALSWLETAIRAYSKFTDICAKTLKDEVDEQAMVKRERRAIQEVRGLLTQMQDKWAEELVANTDATIRDKVRSLVDDWARRSGLEVSNNVAFDLAAHVGELVDKCVGILAPSAESE